MRDHSGQQGDVLAVAVIVVAGVARGLDVGTARHVLQYPVVVVDVAAFYLMRSSGGTPQECGGKSDLHYVLPLLVFWWNKMLPAMGCTMIVEEHSLLLYLVDHSNSIVLKR